MRLTMIVLTALCMMFVTVASPQPAQAGWLEFFFPSIKKKEPDPSLTLKAPFADPDAVIDPTVSKSGLGENSIPLNIRHLSSAIISKWVEQTVSDMITYDAKNYEEQYKQKSASFDATGLKEYVQFLNDQNMVSSLKSGAYNIRSFVKDVPIIINEGEVTGRYRWLYKIKVMISFVKTDMVTYKGTTEDEEMSKDFELTVHIGRSDKAKNEPGLLIEGWNGALVDPNEE